MKHINLVLVSLLFTLIAGTSAFGQATTLVSVNRDGTASGNAFSNISTIDPSTVSGDGRYVVFISNASNLVNNDFNNTNDVFVRDIQTGTTTLVSINRDGVAGGETYGQGLPTISADGRYVAFISRASNLTTTADTNNAFDVFVRDMQTGTTTLVSINRDNTASGNMNSRAITTAFVASFALTPDGRYIAFQSDASDLVFNDTNAGSDIFVRDLLANTTTLVSVNRDGTASGNNSRFGNNSEYPTITPDGRYVGFASLATDLTATTDDNNLPDGFVRDLQTGTTMLVSINRDGVAAGFSNSSSGAVRMSADGRFALFASRASNMTANPDTNNTADAFVRDLQIGTTILVSVDREGNAGGGDGSSVITPDGRYVVFESGGGNFTSTNDTNNNGDVFLRDLQTNTTTLISLSRIGEQSGNSVSGEASISADGRYIAFVSLATNLTLDSDTNNAIDIFVRDLQTRTTKLLSYNRDGTASGNKLSSDPIISFDGKRVVFISEASNLTTLNDTNNSTDVFIAGTTTPGRLAFNPSSYSVNEQTAVTTFTVSRTAGSEGVVSVNYATSDDTAQAGSDYTATSGTLTFAEGETSKSFSVAITDDTSDEPNETFNVTLTNPTGGATLGLLSSARVEINDNDAPPSVNISDISVAEGNSGTTAAIFTVTLSAASGQIVTVDYATGNVTAQSGVDYMATSGRLTFQPGTITQTVSVPVIGDTTFEPDETFAIGLQFATNSSVNDGNGVGTIINDDAAPQPQTYSVTNASDSGVGSLRQAITDANATPTTTDTINFQIASGVQTINLAAALPFITAPVLLDATTQPGYAGTPLIELNGGAAGQTGGLIISGGNTTVRGFVINRFNGAGISISGNGNNRVQNCFIGTDPTGKLDLGNTFDGIFIGSSNNTIGGLTVEARNVISGNDGSGISIGNQFQGTSALAGNIVQGNFIGTDVAGANRLGNTSAGVLIIEAASNQIGGIATGARNVISGNRQDGVAIIGARATNNLVQSNFIGTDVTGTQDIGNSASGVALFSNASLNTIGGATNARNLISGNNGAGVFLNGFGNTGATPMRNNSIRSNFIGTQADGRSRLGKGSFGIDIIGDAQNTGIAGNTIAFTGDDAVGIEGGTGTFFDANSLFSNAGLGINLGQDRVTPNDAGDTDTGANGLQNYPELTFATATSDGTVVQGTLNSTPNATFDIDFYSNTECDPSGFGEGERFRFSAPVTTDANGNATFNFTLPGLLPPNQFITATANNQVDFSISEFSRCLAVTPRARSVQFSALGFSVNESGGAATITVTRAGSTGTTTVNYMTSDGTANAGNDYTATSGTLTFLEGETTKIFIVPITNDTASEANETINLTLTGVSGDAVLGTPPTATLTILDDDARPSVSVAGAIIGEPDTGTNTVAFTVRLSRAVGTSVRVGFTTGDGTATVADNDYQQASGTLVFSPGETVKDIVILVNGDTRDEDTEQFFLNLTALDGIEIEPEAGRATGTIFDNDPGIPGELLISEFRTSGPGGASDEFVELYNNTDAPIDIRNYTLRRRRGTTTVVTSFSTTSLVIPARGHLLIGGQSYSLGGYALRSFIFGTDSFADNDGIEIRRFATNLRIDTVGFTDDTSEFREGAGLPVVAAFPSPVPQYSFVRRMANGRPQDTDNNAADFVLVAPGGESFGALRATPGAPGTENTLSPIAIGDPIRLSLIEGMTPSFNRTRLRSRNPFEKAATGVFTIRRTFTNTNATPITNLRFRVIDLTTSGTSRSNAVSGDARLLSSSGATGDGGETVRGLTLEQPPDQAQGGGLNSSLRVSRITPDAPLPAGASITVEFRLNVIRAGNLNVTVIAEGR